MKKILVVDESRAVRETLALILEQDFVVVQRPVLHDGSSSHSDGGIDLLIFGPSPGCGADPSPLLKIAAQVPFPVLFLVHSKTLARLWRGQGKTDCLAKPFNPYELKERVGRLLAQPEPLALPSAEKEKAVRYLDFPYLPTNTSVLAKRFALTSLPVLILGEVGCAQGRVAKGLHALNKNSGPWISAHSHGITEERLLEQLHLASQREGGLARQATLFLSGLESLPHSAQSSLLRFLEREEERGWELWILSSSRVDLLERVYKEEFLDLLYYRLAALILRVPPLRERQEDLPMLAAHIAQEYAERFGLGRVTLCSDALDRLTHYLWFGNLSEMEAVLARTLAAHRKSLIQAEDLLFMEGGHGEVSLPPLTEGPLPGEAERKIPAAEGVPDGGLRREAGQERSEKLLRSNNNDNYPDLKILINELAHELKNPMVAIKTFAQLLKEKFDDSTFRTKFQDVVTSDIDRMDDLLDVLIEFSHLANSTPERLLLHDQLRRVIKEILPECVRREATIRWGRKGKEEEVLADEAQFRYVFKNILRAVLNQVRPMGEILIDVEDEGRVTISYAREADQMRPLASYLDLIAPTMTEESLPLHILMPKILLEKNGGGIEVAHLDGKKVQINIALPVPQGESKET